VTAVSRRVFLHRALAGAAVPLLAACGPSVPVQPPLSPATAAPASSTPRAIETLARPAPRGRGAGGTLRLLWWQAPTILNSHLASGMKDTDAARLVLEPLSALDPTGAPTPVLASEIPTRDNGGVAPDLGSVTWKLKPNVKWSDGSDFTAADVAFTYMYMADESTAATDAAYSRGVERVEVVDPHTVRIVWHEPNPYPYQLFTAAVGCILQKKQFASFLGAHAKDAPGNLKPIGTGPYKVREFKPGDVAVYEVNDLYRDVDHPFFKEVQLKGGGDAVSAARAVFQTGEVDYAWNLQVEAQVLSQIASGPNAELMTASGTMVERLMFNFSDPHREVEGERSHRLAAHPFLSDVRVRHALAMAVDRNAIAEQLYAPAGEPTTNVVVAPADLVSLNTRGFEHAALNFARANQLLDDAGWRRGSDGLRAKDGVRMSILYQTTVNPVRQKTQEIIKAGWERLGVQVELKAVQAGVFFSSDPGNPDTATHFYADVQMFTSGSVQPDWTAALAQFTTGEIAQKANEWRGVNTTRYSNPEYDRLWRDLSREANPGKRAALTIMLNDHLVREAVLVPLVARRSPVSAKSKRLQGIRPNTWDSELWNIAEWSMTP